MAKALYLLNDAEWRRIEPLLPRGRRGARRVDDRRVISGIVYMLRSGGRWRDCPAGYGPYTTIYNRYNRWSRQGIWHDIFKALTGHSGIFGTVAIDSTHVKAHRSAAGAKGDFAQGIGRSRPRVLLLTAGNVNDITVAADLVRAIGPFRRLIADRGYDADHLRHLIKGRKAEPVIPSTTSRRSPIPYDKRAYKQRNRVERMWCRLKDWRRIATRYDKLARNYLSAAFIAAAVTYWLN